MVDLHTHTNLSDGSQTLTQLLEKAEKTGLSVLSITDIGPISDDVIQDWI